MPRISGTDEYRSDERRYYRLMLEEGSSKDYKVRSLSLHLDQNQADTCADLQMRLVTLRMIFQPSFNNRLLYLEPALNNSRSTPSLLVFLRSFNLHYFMSKTTSARNETFSRSRSGVHNSTRPLPNNGGRLCLALLMVARSPWLSSLRMVVSLEDPVTAGGTSKNENRR